MQMRCVALHETWWSNQILTIFLAFQRLLSKCHLEWTYIVTTLCTNHAV